MREQDAERPASENRNAGRPASRAAISVRPGPALLPRRIAYRAFAVSAPHLGLTLVLPELCRSTERAGLWNTSLTPSCESAPLASAPVRPPEPQPSGGLRRRRRLSSASAIRRATAPSGEESARPLDQSSYNVK